MSELIKRPNQLALSPEQIKSLLDSSTPTEDTPGGGRELSQQEEPGSVTSGANSVGGIAVDNYDVNEASEENEYDHLFSDEERLGLEQRISVLPELTDRQKIIFSSPHTDASPDLDIQPLDEYDRLFSSKPPQGKVEDAAVKQEAARGVSEGSLEFTKSVYDNRDLDAEVKRLIYGKTQLRVGSDMVSNENMAESVRNNSELREELAKYFLDRIEKNIPRFGYRIADNKDKNPNHLGYPKMLSREYASILALSYLDGTFNPEKTSVGDIVLDKDDGMPISGQHRHAAEMLLFDRNPIT